MLVNLYITLILCAVGYFFLSFNFAFNQKWVPALTFMAIAAVLMGVLALSSFNLETEHCENQVTQAQTYLDNSNITVTNYSNAITCKTVQYVDQGMTALWTGLGILCAIHAFLFCYFAFWKDGGGSQADLYR